MKYALLLWFCLASYAFAEQPYPPRISEIHLAKVHTATLPPALTGMLPGLQMFPDRGEKLPKSLTVCPVDLKGDGTTGFFVVSSNHYWVSGDQTIYFFAPSGQKFVALDHFANLYAGTISLGPHVNGYSQVILEEENPHFKHGIIRQLEQYRHGKYERVRLTYYRRGSAGKLQLIQESDLKKASYDGPEDP